VQVGKRVAMLHVCSFPGCETLTLGDYCLAHEQPVTSRAWPRGRPFQPVEAIADYAPWQPEAAKAVDDAELVSAAAELP
jgi:hypothetical protein